MFEDKLCNIVESYERNNKKLKADNKLLKDKLQNLASLSKKLCMMFNDSEEFNIPGYAVKELRAAIAESETTT